MELIKSKNISYLKLNLQHFSESEPTDQEENNASEEQQEETLTLTESELQQRLQQEADRRVTAALKKQEEKMQKQLEQRIEEERREAEELAKLSEAERAKVEREKEQMKFEEQRKQFEEERKAFEREKLFLETEKVLSSEKLPTEFASFVMGESAEKTHENIQVFKDKFQESVQAQVNEVLKGNAPRVGGQQQLSELDQLEKDRQEAIKNRDMATAIAIKNKIHQLKQGE